MRRAIFVYFFIIASMLSIGALGRYENFKEQYEVERLLNERIVIINNFLYSEKDENDIRVLENLKDNLSKIENEAQLDSDMSLLTHIYNNPTDYEYTTKVKIKKIRSIEITENSIKMLANLEWTILNSDFGKKISIASNLIKDYNITCTIKNKNIYLTNIKFVE